MGLFKKKRDPISARSQALGSKIAALEAEIRQLNSTLQHPPAEGSTLATRPPKDRAHPSASSAPMFEPVHLEREKRELETSSGSAHFNDLGVRKYDLIAAWRRFQNQFRQPAPTNPKLVSYLAAGSIKGLRPLRYERRVARNRFVALSLFFALLLWGIIAMLLKNR